MRYKVQIIHLEPRIESNRHQAITLRSFWSRDNAGSVLAHGSCLQLLLQLSQQTQVMALQRVY